MKVEDYIRLKAAEPRRKARELGRIEALMITHERPGLLTKTVKSFLEKTPGMQLTVFDDGSESAEKKRELEQLDGESVIVFRLPRRGFIDTWVAAWEVARLTFGDEPGGLILLEDDLSFAGGWMDTLRTMYEGAADLGFMPGAMSCLRPHDRPQGMILDLGRVKAYQSMAHGFQVNLMPWEVIANEEMIEKAAEEARRGKHGIDVYLLGAISDRMGRTNFVSMESWVAHEGAEVSLVEAQGYRSLKHRGIELVPELRRRSC